MVIKSTKKMPDNLKLVTDLVKELLKLMDVKSVALVKEDSKTKDISVEIENSEETGLLIGSHGMTLSAIQSFLSVSVKQKTGDWVRINVDVGDYKQKQEDYIANLARETAERAISTGKEQYLYNLTPAQRRIIHMELSMDDKIATESFGEGEERYLVVKSK